MLLDWQEGILTTGNGISDALAKLDECDRLIDRLNKMCCAPDRSPRLAAVRDELALVRSAVDAVGTPEDATVVYSGVDRIGATIGELQVGCCAPARMPLYAETLENLTGVQLDVKRHFKQDH